MRGTRRPQPKVIGATDDFLDYLLLFLTHLSCCVWTWDHRYFCLTSTTDSGKLRHGACFNDTCGKLLKLWYQGILQPVTELTGRWPSNRWSNDKL